jgi:hypothetical protein
MFRILRRLIPWPTSKSASSIFDRYVSAPPALQNAVDALPGWSCALPPGLGVQAGSIAAYEDARIRWAIECFGPLEGRRVLELGPLEGGHTMILEAAGASVDAIEANKSAFMRCLIAKEIAGLKRARFWLGDFVKWLENIDETYDLVVASDALDCFTSPLRAIELISRRTDAVYIWTHVAREKRQRRRDRGDKIPSNAEDHYFRGANFRIYRAAKLPAEGKAAEVSGVSGERALLRRGDLLEALKIVGFQRVQTAHEDADHPRGQALSVFARK